MFRRIQNAFAVVAFVCVILGFGYQVWRTSNNPPPSQHQTNYAKGRRNADDTGADNAKPRLSFLSGGIYKVYSYCADKPDSESDQWLHDKFLCDIKATDLVVAICTTLLMLLTAALAFFTFKLWSGAERTAKRQLRAYVMVDKAMALDYGPRPRVQVIFRNLGQTPVHNLTIWATQDVCAYPLYDKPDAPDVLEIVGNAAPRRDQPIGTLALVQLFALDGPELARLDFDRGPRGGGDPASRAVGHDRQRVRPGAQIDTTLNLTGNPTLSPGWTLTGAARPEPLFKSSSFWAQGVKFGASYQF